MEKSDPTILKTHYIQKALIQQHNTCRKDLITISSSECIHNNRVFTYTVQVHLHNDL